ncbi:MAG: hypothetical protein K0Q59_3487 [Paenibacillus sp.]|nr:hypothetical protein [Paenibacillus sp.]
MLMERYYSTAEYTDRHGKTNKEMHIYCELGKKPTIGNFIETFHRMGIEVELSDFINLIFKPKSPFTTSVTSIRILRTVKDHTYKPTASEPGSQV